MSHIEENQTEESAQRQDQSGEVRNESEFKKFVLVTYTPPHQGMINGVPEKYEVSEVETDELETVINRVPIPPYNDAYVLIVPVEHTTKVKRKVTNEVVG